MKKGHRKQKWKLRGIAIAIVCFAVSATGCGLHSFFHEIEEETETWDAFMASIDKDIEKMDRTAGRLDKGQKLSRVIVSQLAEKSTDSIMKLFAGRIKDEIGEEKLRNEVSEAEQKIIR
ncbi:MAG: hypothetical protein KH828_13510 [Clostridiales bacterium]|nr:hypothetical protein [Clostridiales bacterium]